ncbi:rhodanese-like domain-containing protein [Methylomonas sp. MO1]|uniref:rhodanese-like domain-containing protein n=1 Tax=Methylomonas sp. MO1 TaxID=3073619 RepID=UPI0028A41DBC|nr:rhodanese-like domain-containing protein [Methylomonas sp. MO1]MDT4290919.1 rhodanese-like domain-containing protein [Methylomonas sp. MO1]
MKLRLTLFWLGCLFAGQLYATELGKITAEQLLSMQQNQNALVVDVRTAPEWQATGVIAQSQKLESFDSNGHFDQEKWLANLEKLKSSPDQPVILVCRSGNRSGKIGQILTEQLGMKNVYHLSNGIQSWIKDGHPVKADCLTTACK